MSHARKNAKKNRDVSILFDFQHGKNSMFKPNRTNLFFITRINLQTQAFQRQKKMLHVRSMDFCATHFSSNNRGIFDLKKTGFHSEGMLKKCLF